MSHQSKACVKPTGTVAAAHQSVSSNCIAALQKAVRFLQQIEPDFEKNDIIPEFNLAIETANAESDKLGMRDITNLCDLALRYTSKSSQDLNLGMWRICDTHGKHCPGGDKDTHLPVTMRGCLLIISSYIAGRDLNIEPLKAFADDPEPLVRKWLIDSMYRLAVDLHTGAGNGARAQSNEIKENFTKAALSLLNDMLLDPLADPCLSEGICTAACYGEQARPTLCNVITTQLTKFESIQYAMGDNRLKKRGLTQQYEQERLENDSETVLGNIDDAISALLKIRPKDPAVLTTLIDLARFEVKGIEALNALVTLGYKEDVIKFLKLRSQYEGMTKPYQELLSKLSENPSN